MFRRYKPFFKAGMMSLFAYKFQQWMWVLVTALSIVCTVFMWVGVYKSSPNGADSVINGFTFKDMIVYVVFMAIFSFVSFSGETSWVIMDDITEGTIALSLVKPISYRVRMIFTTLGNDVACILWVGLPCFIISYVVFVAIGYIVITSIWAFLLQMLLFLLAQLMAILIFDCIDYIAGTLCFYTTSGWGLNQLKLSIVQFLSGSLLPLAFFPPWLGKILQYSPFVGLSQNPVLIFMGKMQPLEAIANIGLALVWWIVLEVLARFIFQSASKKITVQGG